jgi:flagellar protein FliS
MYSNRVESYQKNQVMTASPLELLVMCYNGAIANLKMAKVKFEEQKFEEKAVALKKFLDIIGELMAALDFQKGGNIATNLNTIYSYIYRRVSEADIKKDTEAFDEAIRILEELRSAWEEISRPQTPTDVTQQPTQGMALQSGSVV